MSRKACPLCGAMREVADGAAFPAHPNADRYPKFVWCVAGDMSGVIIEMEA